MNNEENYFQIIQKNTDDEFSPYAFYFDDDAKQ